MIGKASEQLYEITRCGHNSEYIPNIWPRHFVGETPKKIEKMVHFGAFWCMTPTGPRKALSFRGSK